MSGRLYSPTRTISNRGDLPKFIGQFPCAKAESSHLVYDSLSALYCGIYLEWRPDVVSMAFEPHMLTFEPEASLPELTCHPDYEAILDTGEIEFYEAKYSRDGLRDAEREKLALTAAHFEQRGIPYKVIYREDLEADGFIDTIPKPVLYRSHFFLDTGAGTTPSGRVTVLRVTPCHAHLGRPQ